MSGKADIFAGIRRIVVWILLLSFAFTGCRKSGGLSVQPGADSSAAAAEAQPGILTGVYRGEALPLPESLDVNASKMNAGAVRYDAASGEATLWATDTEGKVHLVTAGTEGLTMDTIIDIPEDRVLETAAFGEQCFVWVTAVYADRYFAEEEVSRLDLGTKEIRTYPGLRSLFSTADRQEGEYGRFQITSSAVDKDGDIWLASGGEIAVLTEDFVLRNSFVSRSYSSALTLSPNGTVYVPSNDGIAILDKKTGQESALRIGTSPSAIVFGEGYDFYYETEQGVFGWDGTSGTLLMNYQNSNTAQGSMRLCGAVDPETLLFAEDIHGLMLCKSLGDIDLSDVPTIEIALNARGAMAYQRSMDIVEYNKSHPETRILLTDYTQFNTDENPTAGSQRLATDLLTGVYKPDIVIAEARSYYSPQAGAEIEMMLEHKLYADLRGYLEADPDLNPANLFGAVRRYFTTEDGGMWGISSGFQVSTLWGPSALLEKWSDGNGSSKGWTLTEMLDFAESLPSDTYLIGDLYREHAAHRLLGPDGYATFVDRENAVCFFDTPEFMRWLKFLYALPEFAPVPDGSTPDLAGLRYDTAEYYFTGHVALECDDLMMTEKAVECLETQFGTKDWTIIGFPAEGHNGSYVQCDEAILMTSFCSQKDLAWNVIRTLATGFDSNIPAIKQKYEERAAEKLEWGAYMILKLKPKEITRSRSNAYSHNGVFPTPDDLDSPGWISIPTAEDFARFEAFLDNDAGYPLTERLSPEISGIIEEEISAYFSGVGSAEDCAKKIQSRVSIWLAEHR